MVTGRTLMAALALTGVAVPVCGAPGEEWQHVRNVAGVDVQARSVDTGLDRHRASKLMCATLPQVVRFVRDASTLPDWVPFTESLQVLEQEERRVVYYLKNGVPWPFRPRDMIYELVTLDGASESELRVSMTGLPERLPLVEGVVRMKSLDGVWLFSESGAGVQVELQMQVDAGQIPSFLGNRRLASCSTQP